VSELNHEHVLLNACFQRHFECFLEEWNELSKFPNFCEFLLKTFPDVVGVFLVGLLSGQENLVSNHLVKFLWTFIEFSKFRAFNETICHIQVLWIHLKQLISLAVVCSLIISQLYIRIDGNSSGGMNMVNSSLRHGIECFKESTCFHLFLVVVKVVNGSVIILVICNLLSHLLQFKTGFPLVLGEGGLKSITEMHLLFLFKKRISSLHMLFDHIIYRQHWAIFLAII